jgi:hypothetical protein
MLLAIMRSKAIRTLGVLLAAVSTHLAWADSGDILPVPDALLKRYCHGVHNSYECAQKIETGEIKTKYMTRVSRCRPEGLCIRLAGKSIILKDKNTDPVAAYSYIAFVPALRTHVVHVQYSEGGSFLVIHDESGRSANVAGFPVPSPNRRRFVSVSMDIWSGYDPNAVELWRIRQGRFNREARFDLSWGPGAATWGTENAVTIPKLCLEETSEDSKHCGTANLIWVNGRWTLSE